MAPIGTISSGYSNNVRVLRCYVAAAFNGHEITEAPGFDISKSKTPEYLAKFPFGKVPGFESADGYTITEGAAIAYYLASKGPTADQLLGRSSPEKAASIMQWAFFADSEVLIPFLTIGGMIAKFVPWDQKKHDDALAGFDRIFQRIEDALSSGENGGNGKYLVGSEGVTYADIMVGGVLLLGMKFMIDAETRAKYPAMTVYVEGLSEMAEFKKGFGEVEFTETRKTSLE